MSGAILGQGYPNANDVAVLVVGNQRFQGWESVEVTASIENAARTFGFAATHRWPGESNPIRIRPDDVAEVWLGPDKVATGYACKVSPSYSAGSHVIAVTGRSKTCDLVDCSAVDAGPQFTKQTVTQIAKALAAPYSVDVVAEVDVGAAIDRFVLEPGEKVYDAIERLARLRSLLVTDTVDGELLLTRAGEEHAVGALINDGYIPGTSPAKFRGNILEAAGDFDSTNRFSEYRCRGQAVASDNTYGKAATSASGEATDDGLARRRVLVLGAEGPADRATCKDRAVWEAATRAGKSVGYSVTVQGWRQTRNGDLWAPNLIVTVRDVLAGIDADLLIVECAYRLNSGGTTCAMQVAPLCGFTPEPPRKASRKGAAVGAWVGTAGLGGLP